MGQSILYKSFFGRAHYFFGFYAWEWKCFVKNCSVGVPLWCCRLRICHCHCGGPGCCCGMDLIPSLGNSACHGCGKKKKKNCSNMVHISYSRKLPSSFFSFLSSFLPPFPLSLLFDFQDCTLGICKFPVQGSNWNYSCQLCHSHSSVGSKPCLRCTPQLTATLDP